MKTSVKANIHNRFDIVKRNIVTGEETRYYAENIVLDQMYTRLCARSTFFVYIAYGTGTGTLSASRTSLFTHKGMVAATTDATSKALPTSWWRRYIVLDPEDEVGTVITEIGVAYSSSSTNLVTHAMLRDMNGNIVSLEKTALDVLTIYATIYVTFSTTDDSVVLCGLPDRNPLINYLIGGTAWPTTYFFAGESTLVKLSTSCALGSYPAIYTSGAISWTVDIENKKMVTDTKRAGVDDANGDLTEFGIGESLSNPIFSVSIPSAGIYSGLTLTDVSAGTGDGAEIDFVLPSKNIKTDTLTVKVDGAETTAFSASQKRAVNHRLVTPMSTTAWDGGPNCLVISRDGRTIAISESSQNYNGYQIWRRINELWYLFVDHVNANLHYFYPTSLSGDGNTVAGYNGSVLKLFDIIDGSAVEKIQPSGYGTLTSCHLSANGTTLIIGTTATPFLYVYDLVENAWEKRTDPTVLPNAQVDYVATSDNGNRIFVYGSSITDHLLIYDWNGTNWTKYDTSGLGVGTYGFQILVSEDGNTFFMRQSSQDLYPYIADLIEGIWTLRTQFPLSSSYAPSLSSDGLFVCAGLGTSGLSVHEYRNQEWFLLEMGAEIIDCGYSALYTDENNNFIAVAAMLGVVQTYNQLLRFFDLAARDTQLTFATPPGLVIEEAVGTGDALETDFALDNTPTGSLIVKLNGVATEAYTLDGATITFTAAPGPGVVITADYKYAPVITASYTVNGIHKTTQRVIDISAEIVFGEVT